MDLIVTDATGKPVASHASYTLDLAFGSGENDFDLQVEDAALKAGSRIMIDGTEYGGIIDDTDVDVDGGLSTVTWHGRDWHGVLASKIIEPDRNNDYLTLSGTIPVIMRTLVSRAGLQGLFTVTEESADHKTTCQFDRYVDLYSGLVKMLRASGLKLRLRNDGDKVAMSAMPVRTIGDSIDSDLIDFTAKQAAHPINHLICLGKGELKDRTVIHWYADANGTFSHTQTLKGLDERTATYELSNAEADELEDKGRQKFQELRTASVTTTRASSSLPRSPRRSSRFREACSPSPTNPEVPAPAATAENPPSGMVVTPTTREPASSLIIGPSAPT